MSLDATIWAWRQQGLRPAQKLTLLSLADRASDSMTAWPSLTRLALDTGLNRRTIIRALDELQERGLIQETGKKFGNGVKEYALFGVHLREDPARPTTSEPVHKSALVYKSALVHKSTLEPVYKSAPHQCTKVHPEPIREPIREPKREGARNPRTPEAKNSGATRKARGSRTCPPDWSPPEGKQYPDGFPLQRELMKFRNHEFSKPRKDWNRTWNNWVIQWEEYQERDGKKPAELEPWDTRRLL